MTDTPEADICKAKREGRDISDEYIIRAYLVDKNDSVLHIKERRYPYDFTPLPDGSGDFTLVNIHKGKAYCKLHGAMNKVSPEGIWRCLRAEPDKARYSEEQRKQIDCRAGCITKRGS
jgi:hypothetical protein